MAEDEVANTIRYTTVEGIDGAFISVPDLQAMLARLFATASEVEAEGMHDQIAELPEEDRGAALIAASMVLASKVNLIENCYHSVYQLVVDPDFLAPVTNVPDTLPADWS